MRLLVAAVLLLALGAKADEPARKPRDALAPDHAKIEQSVRDLEDLLATRLDDDAKRNLRERLFPIAERLVPGDEAAREAYVALLRKRSERLNQRIAEVLEAQGIKEDAKFRWRDALESEQAAVEEEIRAQYGTRTSK